MNILIIFPLLASFFTVFLLMPFWIKKAKSINLLWKDMNRFDKPERAGSGGIITVLGFLVGILLLVAYRVFFLKTTSLLVEMFALLSVILVLAGIGLVDDLLGWCKGGLSRRSRLILVAFASIPLIAINAGKSIISIPFLGTIDVGILYPLILIPLGVVGATTTFNFLAGFNGLEAGQGMLLLTALGIVAFFTGSPWLTGIAAVMIAALLAFLLFNKYPAQVFPGDSLTYTVGGLIAIIPILGNFEKVAVFFFIPYLFETVLKIRGKLVKYSFGKPRKDGSIGLLYDKFYGLEHLVIFVLQKCKIRVTQNAVVYTIWTLQVLVIMAGLLIFRHGIFT